MPAPGRGRADDAVLERAARDQLSRAHAALEHVHDERAGLAADLVLTDTNPLEQPETLREPAGVMLRGRWMPREELRARLAEIAERNRPPVSETN